MTLDNYTISREQLASPQDLENIDQLVKLTIVPLID